MAVDLDELTKSLNKTGAIERLNDLIYYITLASNGFDGLGHYLRAGLVTNVCSTYALEPSSGCRSTFFDPAAESSAAGGAARGRERGPEHADRARAACRPPAPCSRTCSARVATRASTARREQNLDALRQRSERGVSPALERRRAGARLPARG